MPSVRQNTDIRELYGRKGVKKLFKNFVLTISELNFKESASVDQTA